MARSCRVDALTFLKIRPRSVNELRAKLVNKKHAPEVIEETIKYLLSLDLLNDRTFTASWIQYRLARPFGFNRIIQELRSKGVDQEIIDDEVAKAGGQVDQYAQAFDIASRRAKRMENIDLQKKKKRISDFLIRRGFNIDVVYRIIKQIT